jgi:polyhydroxybutyrate depolymerase
MTAGRWVLASFSLFAMVGAACSSDGAGSAAGSGGKPGQGGSTSSGGTASQGGSTGEGSGGTGMSSGGKTGRGGAGSGGVSSGGNPGAGGSGAGGTAGSGGRTGAGGGKTIDAGRDGRPTGGDSSMDAPPEHGEAPDAAVDRPVGAADGGGIAPGCGTGKTTSSCSKSGATKCTLTSNNKTREYYLMLPATYNPSKPYPVVVMLHGMIATAEMALSWFKEIPTNMPDAIYIAPQGLKHAETGGGANGQEVTGWANVNGEDIQFMKDLLGTAEKDYCVDTQRVFAVGFSYGAMFSYAIGCELGGTFRAIAPMSGALLSGCNLSGKPVAMWGSHGTNDTMVPIASGRQARDKILKQNHCGTQTSPVDPSPCVAYQGCDEGYPVTWCEWDGDHNRPPFGNAAVAAFFKQF